MYDFVEFGVLVRLECVGELCFGGLLDCGG